MNDTTRRLDQDDPSDLAVIEKELQAARDKRDEHLMSPEPNEFEQDRFPQWVQTREALEKEVAQHEQAFGLAVEQAPAPTLTKFSDLLKSRREAQGNEGNGQASAMDRSDEWSPGQENEGQQQGNGQQRSLERGYANYAATAEQENAHQKSWEDRERAYRDQNMGQGSVTVEHIENWEMQQKTQAQPEVPSQNMDVDAAKAERDWEAGIRRRDDTQSR